jgi:ABC-type glutathione transport system ATPase component
MTDIAGAVRAPVRVTETRTSRVETHPTPHIFIDLDNPGGTEQTLLRLDDVRIRNRFTGAEVVHGVSLNLRRGHVVGIVGESGSGKTLTCRSILGILPSIFEVAEGSIELLGRDVTALSTKEWTELLGTTITAVFQDPGSYLNPSTHVGKQIAEAIRVKRKVGRRAAKRRTLELLADVKLRDPEYVYHQYPHELSGGMLQRVLLATAIALDPQILIADEVTTALDVTIQTEILDLLIDLKERNGLSLIVVSHDLAVVAQVCDEVLVLRDGEVVEHGPTSQILFEPRHSYTKLLIAEHNLYGLDRFVVSEEETARAADHVERGLRDVLQTSGEGS